RQAVRQVAEHTARAFGAEAEVTLTQGYTVTVNHPGATAYMQRVAADEFGAAHVRTDIPVSMGGEDFAYYQQCIPGVIWRLGIAPADGTPALPLHNAAFDFPDAAIVTGVRLHCALALHFAKFVER
ncbi:MAG: M20/M25/M40 family metallo-hydrolase, partial [Kiritimatiellae bacterium]|nr:M20/M25/M40 family metallo-hydrolase [Kiritimatiellia bacterium]